MPPAIADSEDEGDDDLPLPGSDTVQEAHTARFGTGVGSTHGVHEQSTGSTERIRREIHNAERALFATTEKGTRLHTSKPPHQPSSASPAMQRDKRRSNSIAGPQSSAGPQKRVKRSHTTKTYGSKHRAIDLPHEEGALSFEELMQNDQSQVPDAPVRSQTDAAETASGDAPQDSLQAQFAEHEPTPMFKDTSGSGSTVPDNTADERRIQACLGRLGEGYAVHAGPGDTASHESSSLPLSAFEYTQSIKGNGEQNLHAEVPHETVTKPTETSPPTHQERPLVGNESSVGHAQSSIPKSSRSGNGTGPPGVSQNESQSHFETTNEADKDPGLQVRPRSSPVVQIHPHDVHSTPLAASLVEGSRKTSTRKREEDDADKSEALNSDDRAVGLPKERYVPRLSKRRATATTLVEPHDFSVMPEKAAKAKRAKTVDATVALQESTQESIKCRPSGGELSIGASPTMQSRDGLSSATEPSLSSVCTTGGTKGAAGLSTAAIQSNKDDIEVGQNAVGKEEAAFKKPAAKPKSSVKAKRAHTTLFEDNVDYISPQRSQTLKQQQEARTLALQDKDSKNATRLTQRKSRVVASSDDEEEIVVTSAVEDTAIAHADSVHASEPAKRGRGRPSKLKATATASATKSVADAEDEPSDGGNMAQTKKRGRGRPPKASAAALVAEVPAKEPTPEPSNNTDPDKTTHSSKMGASETARGHEQIEDDTSPTPAEATVPTPSPEKPVDNASTPKRGVPKSSTASHSPIKSSSKVPLRVGLSKRHRIAPLLRMTKPTTR